MRVSRARDQELLFSKYDWHDIVRVNEEAIKKQASTKRLEHFSGSIDELAAKLAGEFTPEPPMLLVDDISVERKEVEVERARDGYSRRDPFYSGRAETVTKNAVEVTVPVQGDTAMLLIRPTTYDMNPPRAAVSKGHISFVIVLDTEDPTQIRSRIDQRIADIELYLNRQRESAEGLPGKMLSLAKRELEHRRSQLGAADDVVNNLGYKVKGQGD